MDLDWIFSDTGLGLGRVLGYVFVPLLAVGLLALEARRLVRRRRARRQQQS